MNREKEIEELIKKYLPLREKETLHYLKDYCNLKSSGTRMSENLTLSIDELEITGFETKSFEKDMQKMKISYIEVYDMLKKSIH
ncbi:hypothetical protein [Sebaldella termitidis]|uniref:hypothetical protein n=1 Tax=Sebaldella termitidis TaxID=826 RepID=UPI003EBABE41